MDPYYTQFGSNNVPPWGPFQIGPTSDPAAFLHFHRLQAEKAKRQLKEDARIKFRRDLTITWLKDKNEFYQKFVMKDFTPNHEDYHLIDRIDLAFREDHFGCKKCYAYYWTHIWVERIGNAFLFMFGYICFVFAIVCFMWILNELGIYHNNVLSDMIWDITHDFARMKSNYPYLQDYLKK